MARDEDIQLWHEYQNDWNRMASELFRVRLDEDQMRILSAIQKNRRVSVRSGHARGKDYVAALASLCFLYSYYPSKVINTAPTNRQVQDIMMTEIRKIHNQAVVKLPGEITSSRIRFINEPDWFMEGFKTRDKAKEEWSGFHSPNIMIVITEASGLQQDAFDAIEGLLTGNSKLVLIFNPNQTTGEAYQSTRSPEYMKFKLNCLNAPNVLAKKIIIPGQVDYEWVQERIRKWCQRIDKAEFDESKFDFEWEGECHRPNDLFLIKVLGEFPLESEDQLVPLSWVEMAVQRWQECNGKQPDGVKLKLGVDVAGMGRDKTVFAYRYANYLASLESFAKSDHMETVGRAKNRIEFCNGTAYIDSIGEGAGVYSRGIEQKLAFVSVKSSEGAKNLHDVTGERTFANMRAYLHWAVRDALNPQFNSDFMLPPDDELIQEITEPRYKTHSNGEIIIEEKENIKDRLKRSPDKFDALLLTFYPENNPVAGSMLQPQRGAYLKQRRMA